VYGPLSIFIGVALIAAMDTMLGSVFSSVWNVSVSKQITIELVCILPGGLLGLFFASRMGFPWWWRPSDGSIKERWVSAITIILGAGFICINVLSVPLGTAADHPLLQVTPFTTKIALAVSLRAALNEEIFFRLFVFSVAAWAINRVIHSRDGAIMIGAVVSAFLYALLHTPRGGMIFPVGLLFIYIYYKRGLLPVMVIHFFADAIPLVLLSII